MEKCFYTGKEVADVLRVNLKTLQNRAVGHPVYRPCRKGIWHAEQVKILVKIWAGAITESQGLAMWESVLLHMRVPLRREQSRKAN